MTIHSTNQRGGGGGDASALRARPRTRWSRSPSVLERPTRQGTMVLPPEGAAVLLTGVAARVWAALAQPAAEDQLAGRLASPAGGDAGPPADQVAAVLRDLRAIGAVREIR